MWSQCHYKQQTEGYRHQSCINSTHHKSLLLDIKELIKIRTNSNPSDSELVQDLAVLVTTQSAL